MRSRSSASVSCSSSASKAPISATRCWYSLNFFASPTLSARSSREGTSKDSSRRGRESTGVTGAGVGAPAAGRAPARWRADAQAEAARPAWAHAQSALGLDVGLAAVAQFVAVALDLARELVDHQVERMEHLGGGVARAQRHALQIERALGHLAVGHARIGLLEDLDLQAGQVGDLARDLAQTALGVRAQLVGDRHVATLDVDLHRRLPSVRPLAFDATPGGGECERAWTGVVVAEWGADRMSPNLSWSLSPGVLIAAALLGGAYLKRWRTVRRSSSPRRAAEAPVWRLCCFMGSILAALTALISPLDNLADQLFFMHMIQHMLLLDIVPILGSSASRR